MLKIAALIFVFFGISSHARTLGGLDEDKQYQASQQRIKREGSINILVYYLSTNTIANTTVFSSPKYEVRINDILIAKISQRFWDIARQTGKFNYFSASLPVGIYKVSVIQDNRSKSDAISEFDVVIRDGKEISITVVNNYPETVRGISAQLGDLETVKSAEFNKENLDRLKESVRSESLAFSKKEEIFLEEEKKKERLEALETERLREKVRLELEEKEEKKRKFEKQKAEDEARKLKEIELARQKEKNEKEKQIELEDHKVCISVGAKPDTPSYVSCRVSLIVSRKEQKEREDATKLLEAKIEALQFQIEMQERDRGNAAAKAEIQRQEELSALQRQLAQDRARQEKAQREARAERAFAAAAGLIQPMNSLSSPPPSPFHTYQFNGKTWNCTTLGGITTCN